MALNQSDIDLLLGGAERCARILEELKDTPYAQGAFATKVHALGADLIQAADKKFEAPPRENERV